MARWLLTLVWCAAVSPFLSAQTTYTIYGIVRLPDGEAAPRVMVHAAGQSGLDRQVFSDDMGRYEIRELPRGRYRLTVTNPASPDDFTDPVEADTGRSLSGRVLVHLYLRRKAKATESREISPPVISLEEASQEIPKDAKKAYDRALKQRSEGKMEPALKQLARALEVFPGYFQAQAERGHLFIAMGRVEEAAAEFARSLEHNPHYGPALRGAGLCKFESGRYEDAIRDLERAIEVEPAMTVSHLFLGISHLALDRREAARTALFRALSLDPIAAARARVHLANLHLREERLQDALTQLEAYLSAVPDAPDAEKLRAVAAQLRSRLR